jgi:hypothetical protein
MGCGESKNTDTNEPSNKKRKRGQKNKKTFAIGANELVRN